MRNILQIEIYIESCEIVIFVSQRGHIDSFTQFCLIIGFSVAMDVGDKEKGTRRNGSTVLA